MYDDFFVLFSYYSRLFSLDAKIALAAKYGGRKEFAPVFERYKRYKAGQAASLVHNTGKGECMRILRE